MQRFVIFGLMALLCACSGEKKDRSQNIINDAYLNSSSFKNFAGQALKERTKSVRQKRAFEEFLSRQLSEESGHLVQSSFRITSSHIAERMKTSASKPPVITHQFGLDQMFYPLARFQNKGLNFDLFAVCKIASYKDCLIWLASSRGADLLDVQALSAYNRNLTIQETPTIQVNMPEIEVHLRRVIRYGIKSDRSYEIRFSIAKNGYIFRIK